MGKIKWKDVESRKKSKQTENMIKQDFTYAEKLS